MSTQDLEQFHQTMVMNGASDESIEIMTSIVAHSRQGDTIHAQGNQLLADIPSSGGPIPLANLSVSSLTTRVITFNREHGGTDQAHTYIELLHVTEAKVSKLINCLLELNQIRMKQAEMLQQLNVPEVLNEYTASVIHSIKQNAEALFVYIIHMRKGLQYIRSLLSLSAPAPSLLALLADMRQELTDKLRAATSASSDDISLTDSSSLTRIEAMQVLALVVDFTDMYSSAATSLPSADIGLVDIASLLPQALTRDWSETFLTWFFHRLTARLAPFTLPHSSFCSGADMHVLTDFTDQAQLPALRRVQEEWVSHGRSSVGGYEIHASTVGVSPTASNSTPVVIGGFMHSLEQRKCVLVIDLTSSALHRDASGPARTGNEVSSDLIALESLVVAALCSCGVYKQLFDVFRSRNYQAMSRYASQESKVKTALGKIEDFLNNAHRVIRMQSTAVTSRIASDQMKQLSAMRSTNRNTAQQLIQISRQNQAHNIDFLTLDRVSRQTVDPDAEIKAQERARALGVSLEAVRIVDGLDDAVDVEVMDGIPDYSDIDFSYLRLGANPLRPDNGIPDKLYFSLYQFQLATVDFMLKRRGRCLVGDEMGCGKTLQALAGMCLYRDEWPALVIVPTSLRYNWVTELLRWCNEVVDFQHVQMVSSSNDVLSVPLHRGAPSVVIVSYSVAVLMRKELFEIPFGVIVCDESHYLKNSGAKRTQALIPLIKKIPRALLLSGTPMLSKPEEVFTQAHALKPKVFCEAKMFNKRYQCTELGSLSDQIGEAKLALIEQLRTIERMMAKGDDNAVAEARAKVQEYAQLHARTKLRYDSYRGQLRELLMMLKEHVLMRRVKRHVLTELKPKTRSAVNAVIDAKHDQKRYAFYERLMQLMPHIESFIEQQIKGGRKLFSKGQREMNREALPDTAVVGTGEDGNVGVWGSNKVKEADDGDDGLLEAFRKKKKSQERRSAYEDDCEEEKGGNRGKRGMRIDIMADSDDEDDDDEDDDGADLADFIVNDSDASDEEDAEVRAGANAQGASQRRAPEYTSSSVFSDDEDDGNLEKYNREFIDLSAPAGNAVRKRKLASRNPRENSPKRSKKELSAEEKAAQQEAKAARRAENEQRKLAQRERAAREREMVEQLRAAREGDGEEDEEQDTNLPFDLSKEERQLRVIEEHLRKYNELSAGMQRAVFMKMYQLTGLLKIPFVTQYIEDLLDNDKKFIVFAHHIPVLDAVQEVLERKKVGFFRVDGSVSAEDRQRGVDKFQSSNKMKVALLSVVAAGVGLTLTKADLVVFCELYWNPSALLQAEDRVHRVGQVNAVTVQYVLAENSLDKVIWPKLVNKMEVVGSALVRGLQYHTVPMLIFFSCVHL